MHRTVSRPEEAPLHIVIVELHYHAELIKTLVQILMLENFRISLITLPGIYKKASLAPAQDEERLHVYLKKPEQSLAEFLGSMNTVFESADITYLNTIRHFWREFNSIPLSGTSIVRIHNAHTDFTRFSHLHRPLANSLGFLSHLIRKVLIGREWKLKKDLFDKVDYFMFPNQAITDYVVGNGWINPEKVLPPVLPFGFLGKGRTMPKASAQDVVTIAITGKVTNSKKDFDLVYHALRKCIGSINTPIRLVLLGNAGQKHAQSIIRNYKSLESAMFSLDYTEGYVPSEVFDEKVASVDFFLAPIQIDTHFRKYHEVYGKSKMSGIENDILLYKKPSLVVSGYRMTGPLDSVVGYFEPTPESLAAKITEWVNGRTFDSLNNGFEHMDSYKREVIASNFYNLCREII